MRVRSIHYLKESTCAGQEMPPPTTTEHGLERLGRRDDTCATARPRPGGSLMQHPSTAPPSPANERGRYRGSSSLPPSLSFPKFLEQPAAACWSRNSLDYPFLVSLQLNQGIITSAAAAASSSTPAPPCTPRAARGLSATRGLPGTAAAGSARAWGRTAPSTLSPGCWATGPRPSSPSGSSRVAGSPSPSAATAAA